MRAATVLVLLAAACSIKVGADRTDADRRRELQEAWERQQRAEKLRQEQEAQEQAAEDRRRRTEAERVRAEQARLEAERVAVFERERQAALEANAKRIAELEPACLAHREEQARLAREREEREAAEAARLAEVDAWREENCKLEYKASYEVVNCKPLCIAETIRPCPEYRCRKRPPDKRWLDSWNLQACAQFRGVTNRVARTIGDVHGSWGRQDRAPQNDPCAELDRLLGLP